MMPRYFVPDKPKIGWQRAALNKKKKGADGDMDSEFDSTAATSKHAPKLSQVQYKKQRDGSVAARITAIEKTGAAKKKKKKKSKNADDLDSLDFAGSETDVCQPVSEISFRMMSDELQATKLKNGYLQRKVDNTHTLLVESRAHCEHVERLLQEREEQLDRSRAKLKKRDKEIQKLEKLLQEAPADGTRSGQVPVEETKAVNGQAEGFSDAKLVQRPLDSQRHGSAHGEPSGLKKQQRKSPPKSLVQQKVVSVLMSATPPRTPSKYERLSPSRLMSIARSPESARGRNRNEGPLYHTASVLETASTPVRVKAADHGGSIRLQRSVLETESTPVQVKTASEDRQGIKKRSPSHDASPSASSKRSRISEVLRSLIDTNAVLSTKPKPLVVRRSTSSSKRTGPNVSSQSGLRMDSLAMFSSPVRPSSSSGTPRTDSLKIASPLEHDEDTDGSYAP
jgi:hypothetical protein